MCSVCLQAKVRPFLKNVQLPISTQWFPDWHARSCFLQSWVEWGQEEQKRGQGWEERKGHFKVLGFYLCLQ